MSGVSGVSWYALLGVSPDASPEEIKAAWRTATDKFEPGSGTGQFRLFNEAADVLLDPVRRAEYDAEYNAGPDSRSDSGSDSGRPVVVLEPTPEPVPPVVLKAPVEVEERAEDKADGASPAVPSEVTPLTDHNERSRWFARPVPAWVMAVLGLLSVVALALGGLFLVQHRSYQHRQDAGQEASAAAERALPVVLSYDYRHLTADRDKAARYLSPKYRKEYIATFDKLIQSSGSNPGPAEQTKAVVTANVQNIGVVDAEADVARVIVFLDQSTVKAAGTPKFSLNRLTVSMVKVGNAWLVDNINSY
ncbi:MAG: J domain-containing protein [Actinomycetota bacterium]|nr:J domain-containing protein [Actinomycetota bacterium]